MGARSRKPAAKSAKRTARTRRPSRQEALARVLESEATCDRVLALSRDPVQFPRRYADPNDRALAAMLAALMAFGRVETIRAKLGVLLELLGPSPARTARDVPADELVARLEHFRHRTFRGDDIARLVHAAGRLIARDGALFAHLEESFRRHQTLRGALADYTDELRAIAWPGGPTRTARHLLPDPRGPSACKRLALMARWIVRPDDGVDLGLCAIPSAALVIPLDVHIHRIARTLGFTRRDSASWQAAEEVTEALRGLDANDPVRFDFALCHVAIDAVRTRRA